MRFSRGGSLLAVMAITTVAALQSGCQSGEKHIGPGQPEGFTQQIRRLQSSSLEIGPVRKAGTDDKLMVRTIGFRGDLEFEPFILPGSYEIEYLPAVEAGDASSLSFDFFICDKDGKEQHLDSRSPLAVRHRVLTGDRRAISVADVVRVDLSQWSGQSVVLKWRLIDQAGSSNARVRQKPMAHIARLALRRIGEVGKCLPDILLVCSDTHRFDYGVALDRQTLMPNLDRFARSAVRFDQAISTASWTLPSVASVLTGLYPRSHHTGRSVESGSNADWESGRKLAPGQFKMGWGDSYHVISAFPAELDTMAERLGRLGYTTVVVSANGLLRLSGLGQDGVDLFHSIGQSRADRVEEVLLEMAPVLKDRRPLFLYIHLMDVHEYQNLALSSVPEEVKLEGPAAVQRHRYRNEVGVVDRFFGSLIDWWDGGPGRDGSMVTFFSDHGEHLRDPGGPKHGHGISMHDVLLHVPLVVRFPVSVRVEHMVVKRTVSLVDLAATMLDLAGEAVAAETLPGRSLVDIVEEDSGEGRVVFADYQLMGDEQSASQTGRYKLVKNFTLGTSTLYDMTVASEYGEPAQVVQDQVVEGRLERAFAQYVLESEAVASNLRSQQLIDPGEAEAQLKALGYID